jgi:hypothetical protein
VHVYRNCQTVHHGTMHHGYHDDVRLYVLRKCLDGEQPIVVVVTMLCIICEYVMMMNVVMN